jgi:thiol-disulfide isomerase/thioredoxin
MNRFLVPLILAFAPAAVAQSLNGLWDAMVVVNGLEIPFKMDFADDGVSFFNGDEKITSTSGRFEDGKLVLNYDHYGTKLTATLKDGVLEGQYGREGRQYPFRAKRFVEEPVRRMQAPAIDGMWQIQVQSPKGESAWKLIVRQKGVFASAAILRIDGDTGTLTGRYKDGKFVLSHFSGARPSLLEITPQDDGTLDIVQNGKNKYVAYRPEVARARGLGEPTDPSQHTHMGNPAEPLRFSFADLNGKVVSNTDGRFQGKVVLVNVMGSWCPNCHDETPFLVELYRKYHSQGLEIVALSFEESEQLANPVRLRSFIQHYGIEYTVLVPGTPDDLHQKLTQPVNLNSWPTTFLVGRDGKVHAIHAGFPGAASGALHQQAKEEITSLVEGLLGVSAAVK